VLYSGTVYSGGISGLVFMCLLNLKTARRPIQKELQRRTPVHSKMLNMITLSTLSVPEIDLSRTLKVIEKL